MNVKNTKTDQADSKLVSVPFLLFCIFAITRPICSLSFFASDTILGLKLSEAFGIASSYLFILLILINLRDLKLDTISFLVIYFCAYICLSVVWGSPFREISRLVLPFSVFFVARSSIESKKQVKIILGFLVIGLIFPTISSFWFIISGQSVFKTVYQTGVVRHAGMYTGPHALAHSTFIFIVVLALIDYYRKNSWKSSIGISVLCLFALYNIYKSFTRTVYVGIAVFSLVYLWGRHKYLLLLLYLTAMALVVVFSSEFKTIFFDVYEPLQDGADLGKMGSGRIGGWDTLLTFFANSSIVDQIRGFGISLHTTITSGAYFGGSHNDFISVLICFGYIGLTLYLSIYAFVCVNMMRSKMPRRIRSTFLAFFLSVGAMNLVSNSYLSRFELGQYFALLMGISLSLDEISRKDHHSHEIGVDQGPISPSRP